MLELSADRQAARDAADLQAARAQHLGQIMRGGFAFGGEVRRQNDFLDDAVARALEQRFKGDILGPDAVEWRQPPHQHEIQTVKSQRLLQHQQIGGHFHNDNSITALRDIPGLVVGCPSRGDDAATMLRTLAALAKVDGRVTVFLEPIALYMTKDLYEPGDGLWLTQYPAPGRVTRRYGELPFTCKPEVGGWRYCPQGSEMVSRPEGQAKFQEIEK